MSKKDEDLWGRTVALWYNASDKPFDQDKFEKFKQDVKTTAENYAKAVLEEFIDDHFPENSLCCKTRVSAKLDSLKEGESWSFYATKEPIPTKFKINVTDSTDIRVFDLIGRAMADTVLDIESIMAKSAEETSNQNVSRETSSKYIIDPQFKVGDKVYALIDSEIKKCRISEIDGSNLPIMLIDEDDNIEWFALEEVFYTINELLDHLREKAKDL